MKSKTSSVRLLKETYDDIDSICDDIGCTRNDWIKEAIDEKLEGKKSQDQEPKPEPKIFDCRDGNLYHDGKLFGSCANHLSLGKVYDDDGNLVGRTRDSIPKGELLAVKVYDDDGKLVGQTRDSIPKAKVTAFSNDGGKTWYDAN